MSDDSKVVDLAAAARKRGRTLRARPQASVQISGNHNVGVAGDNNHVEITVKAAPPRRAKIVVQAGHEHITEAQAAELQELVAKVVKLSGKTYPFVWGALRKRTHCASYRMMLPAHFEDARVYLRKWIASTSVLGPGVKRQAIARTTLLARIHVEAKKKSGLLDRIHDHTRACYGASSLADLKNEELIEVVREFGL